MAKDNIKVQSGKKKVPVSKLVFCGLIRSVNGITEIFMKRPIEWKNLNE
jgi:hypothetical protein